jgi:hypothetical protein
MNSRPLSFAPRMIASGRQRDRLLQEDVLAGGERSLGHLAMEQRRQADVDSVELRITDRRVEVGRCLGPDALGNPRGALERL